jgi:hypothetical protein
VLRNLVLQSVPRQSLLQSAAHWDSSQVVPPMVLSMQLMLQLVAKSVVQLLVHLHSSLLMMSQSHPAQVRVWYQLVPWETLSHEEGARLVARSLLKLFFLGSGRR